MFSNNNNSQAKQPIIVNKIDKMNLDHVKYWDQKKIDAIKNVSKCNKSYINKQYRRYVQ